MTNYLPLLLGVIGIVLFIASFINVKLGDHISSLHTIKSGAPWYSKPHNSSRIASAIVIGMFISGSYLVWEYMNVDMIYVIAGTVTIIFAAMISFTNLILAGAVINAINNKG